MKYNNIFLTAFLLGLITQLSLATSDSIIPNSRKNFYRIAFGSCASFYRNHDTRAYKQISEQNADVFVWLGDVAYADTMMLPGYFWPESDEYKVRQKYHHTKNDPNYQVLRNTTKIVGVWDDHDYGINNGGINFQYKDQNKEIFLDFLDEPEYSPRRFRQGVYESYYIGQDKKIKIILTDGRYSRDESKGDILGEEQWTWLEQELNDSQVELFVLGSGTQVLPDDREPAEFWFIESKKRLYKLIDKYNASVFLISGDIHMAEYLSHPCSQQEVGYDLQEMTSSGLSLDFDHVFPHVDEMTKITFTNTYSGQNDRYFKQNYGIIDIKLDQNDILNSDINTYIFGKESIISPAKQRSFKLKDFKKKDSLKDESQCEVNNIQPADRKWKFKKEALYSEVIEKQNKNLIMILGFYAVIILLIIRVYYWLLRILTGTLRTKKLKQE